jgi:hypothetical protein
MYELNVNIPYNLTKNSFIAFELRFINDFVSSNRRNQKGFSAGPLMEIKDELRVGFKK